MNKRIRINGKLYEAVTPVDVKADKNDLRQLQMVAKYAEPLVKKRTVNRNNLDTLYDVTLALLDLLDRSGVRGEDEKYNNSAINQAKKRLAAARITKKDSEEEEDNFAPRVHGPRRF